MSNSIVPSPEKVIWSPHHQNDTFTTINHLRHEIMTNATWIYAGNSIDKKPIYVGVAFDGSEQNDAFGVIAVLRSMSGSLLKSHAHYAAPHTGWSLAAISALNELQIKLMVRGNTLLVKEQEVKELEKKGLGKVKEKWEDWRVSMFS